jgi:hypothetical protein
MSEISKVNLSTNELENKEQEQVVANTSTTSQGEVKKLKSRYAFLLNKDESNAPGYQAPDRDAIKAKNIEESKKGRYYFLFEKNKAKRDAATEKAVQTKNDLLETNTKKNRYAHLINSSLNKINNTNEPTNKEATPKKVKSKNAFKQNYDYLLKTENNYRNLSKAQKSKLVNSKTNPNIKDYNVDGNLEEVKISLTASGGRNKYDQVFVQDAAGKKFALDEENGNLYQFKLDETTNKKDYVAIGNINNPGVNLDVSTLINEENKISVNSYSSALSSPKTQSGTFASVVGNLKITGGYTADNNLILNDKEGSKFYLNQKNGQIKAIDKDKLLQTSTDVILGSLEDLAAAGKTLSDMEGKVYDPEVDYIAKRRSMRQTEKYQKSYEKGKVTRDLSKAMKSTYEDPVYGTFDTVNGNKLVMNGGRNIHNHLIMEDVSTAKYFLDPENGDIRKEFYEYRLQGKRYELIGNIKDIEAAGVEVFDVNGAAYDDSVDYHAVNAAKRQAAKEKKAAKNKLS